MTNTKFLDYIEEKLRENGKHSFTPEERSRLYTMEGYHLKVEPRNLPIAHSLEDIQMLRVSLAFEVQVRITS